MNAEEPLLTGAVDYENYDSLNQDLTQGGKYQVSVKSEFVFITKSSIPLVATFFLQYLLSVTSIYAAGKLGPKELAAASLGVCTFNITGLAVYQGMATSLDSLCSQAYGSGRIENVGLYFQRCSMMILAITIFPLFFIWWFSGFLLGFVIPDAELVAMTQTFLRISSFGAPGLLFFETGKRFLQAQHIFNAGTYVLLVIAPLNLTINWLLVWHPVYGLGFIGAPIAISIIFWLTSILMLCYVLFIDGKKCWGGLDLQKACSNWSPMLKLAIPGVIMVEAEYLAFEVLTIFAASFGTEALAAQSIASNVGSLTFQLPFAIAVSISTRIGHHVGKQDVEGAKLVTRLSYIFGTISALTNFSLVFFGRHALGRLFTSSEEVLKVSNVILILLAINQLCDSYNVLGAGVLRGQGRQRIGSILNLISYYAIALPVGYALAFYGKFELRGLWFGLIAGVFFLAVAELVAIVRSNWRQIMIDSHGRHDH
ncbi:MATE efflux family protein [Suhomyces tanzawaensis NRRL Y-17324]|uniref:MATE efflux family protein n=1 Tax=Suhomyces tanzawaensis NRRL Y-17324 TaxID=984487 RepID=A0A1E4SJ59_9ASCO|nr:MATE efflux family protein [Suhomyces tanzawaensis NRRL Y-17324]ODV79546.1 MATE efflux family protein [Suhomyces tanzawaensis NRRL Y-17324]